MGKHDDLLEKMLRKGFLIEVINGELNINKSDGALVARAKFKNYEKQLFIQLAKLMEIELFEYTDYCVKPANGYSKATLTLNFLGITSGDHIRIYLNVSTKRVRTSKAGKAGDELPKGKFNLSDRAKLVTLWRRWGLPEPKKLSQYSSQISKLKKRKFVGSTIQAKEGLRFDKNTLVTLNLSHNQLSEKLTKNTASRLRALSNLTPKINQFPTKKSNQETLGKPAVGRATAKSNCVGDYPHITNKVQSTTNRVTRTNKSSVDTSNINTQKKSPQDQTNEEWEADLGSIPDWSSPNN